MNKEERVQHEVDAILGKEAEDGSRELHVYEHGDGTVGTYTAGDDLDEYIASVTKSGDVDAEGDDGDDD